MQRTTNAGVGPRTVSGAWLGRGESRHGDRNTTELEITSGPYVDTRTIHAYAWAARRQRARAPAPRRQPRAPIGIAISAPEGGGAARARRRRPRTL